MIANLFVDALLMATAGLVAFAIYPGWDVSALPPGYATLIFVGVLINMGVSNNIPMKEAAFVPYKQISRVLMVWLTSWGMILAWLVFSKTAADYSRGWLSVWPALALGFQLTFATSTIFFRRRTNVRAVSSTLLIGSSTVTQDLVQRFSHRAATGASDFRICTADDPETIRRHADDPNLREIWICLDNQTQVNLKQLIEGPLQSSCSNIRVVPFLDDSIRVNHGVSVIEGVPMVDVVRSPMHGINAVMKSAEDKVLALMFIIFFSPIYVFLALAVKLSSPGPILYAQERVGWNGKIFRMLKFRSMAVDAESGGVKWGAATEKRVTKIGALMRKTSLDEIPQFFNVLLGDMSIVGPRPERPMFVDQFRQEIPRYMQKHLVKAGITGWAQINGWRGDTDLHQRVSHDLYYIDNWSIWFDLKIVFLTPFRGLVHKNAK